MSGSSQELAVERDGFSLCARLTPNSYSFSLCGSDGLCSSGVLKPAGS